MKQILDGIRADIGAEYCCRSCSRDGCQALLDDVPRERIVVDVERVFEAQGRQGKRCDFVVFLVGNRGELLIAPIELKSGRVDVSDALEQLQEGATFTEQFASKASGAVCRPILIHRHGLHSKDRKILNRTKVLFHGVGLTVLTERCGRPRNLANALGM